MMQYAIFDVDGTLLDSMFIWEEAVDRTLRQKGIVPEEGLIDAIMHMSMEEGAAYVKERYRLPESSEEILTGIVAVVEQFYREEAGFKKDVRALLDEFKNRNVKMVVATSGSAELAGAALERLGVRDYFLRIFSCGEIGAGKTQPDIFLKAAETLGSTPAETWVFEDAIHAVRTAKRCGFKVTAIYDESSKKDWEEIRSLGDVVLEEADSYMKFFEEQE
ncbi:HAD family hydrolase [Coprococcus catus]